MGPGLEACVLIGDIQPLSGVSVRNAFGCEKRELSHSGLNRQRLIQMDLDHVSTEKGSPSWCNSGIMQSGILALSFFPESSFPRIVALWS